MQLQELETRTQAIYKASQLPPGSGFTCYYMCPVNKVTNIVELAYVAYQLSLQPNCTPAQKQMLNRAMQAMYKRHVYKITGTPEQKAFAKRLLAICSARAPESVAHPKFFGPNYKSIHLQ